MSKRLRPDIHPLPAGPITRGGACVRGRGAWQSRLCCTKRKRNQFLMRSRSDFGTLPPREREKKGGGAGAGEKEGCRRSGGGCAHWRSAAAAVRCLSSLSSSKRSAHTHPPTHTSPPSLSTSRPHPAPPSTRPRVQPSPAWPAGATERNEIIPHTFSRARTHTTRHCPPDRAAGPRR